ncbi:hypothetical protein SEA_EVY_148 [Streptomyces phage Evy]|uniref:Uncharacterized protein n=1 Tax=Streptomyces phage Evy TaxID=2588514 RepID=A0A514DK46_9CAUD|nr:hypothetical protein KNU67_gp133 [Streptomyces phage Evy]QDH93999.1 hypothetical protein SEA_EVY_148 [Streptomyces phage Evy]
MKKGLAALLTQEESVEGNRATVKERMLGPLQARDTAQRWSAASLPMTYSSIGRADGCYPSSCRFESC